MSYLLNSMLLLQIKTVLSMLPMNEHHTDCARNC
jgi:hypothetical protein